MSGLSVADKRILGVVFSKDRALQLDATLRSYQLHCEDASAARIVVFYLATSTRHQSQYDQLAKEYADRAEFVPETGFRRQVLEILKSPMHPDGHADSMRRRWWTYGRHETRGGHVLFLVDDCLFTRRFRLGDVVQALDAENAALGFSLRLGSNTAKCYVLDRQQSLPEFKNLSASVLEYKWLDADGDFAYPLELSSSVYPLELMIRLISKLGFRDPNTLESQMSTKVRGLAHRWPMLLCFERSVAFSVPLNRVQTVFANRVTASEDFSAERLADIFEKGQRINVQSLSGFVPSACHQEVRLIFEDRR